MRPEPPRPSRSSRIAAAGRDVWRAAVGEKVAAGRLRDLNWPYGLNAVVALVLVMCGVAAGLALLSGPLRASSELLIPNQLSSSTPVGVVWLVTFLVVVGLTVFAQAALHGPWWLKVLGVAVGASLLMIWGVTGGVGATLLAPALAAALSVGLLVFWIVRGRRPFAWWEFPVLLGLFGVGIGVPVAVLSRSGENLGFQFTPLLLQQAASFLAYLVLRRRWSRVPPWPR